MVNSLTITLLDVKEELYQNRFSRILATSPPSGKMAAQCQAAIGYWLTVVAADPAFGSGEGGACAMVHFSDYIEPCTVSHFGDFVLLVSILVVF
jgi:hypothetical protein